MLVQIATCVSFLTFLPVPLCKWMDSPETRLNFFPYYNNEHLKVQLYEVRNHQRRGEGPTLWPYGQTQCSTQGPTLWPYGQTQCNTQGPTLWPSGQTQCSTPSNSRRSSVYSADSIPHRIWVQQYGYDIRKITKTITRDLQIFTNKKTFKIIWAASPQMKTCGG